ncbi:Mce protein [Mycobacterium paraense]|uniref:Mce protein n=1 Tax=Mycobacterium paraense TaxID=767916 RepID=UPI0011516EDC|nr:Mce protein [Mycobacterium paraense]
MEGDAGAGRLNPPPMPRFRRLRRPSQRSSPKIHQEPAAAAEETTLEVTAEDSTESEDGTVRTSPEATAEEPEAAEAEATAPAAIDAPEPQGEATAAAADVERRPSRMGRWWLSGIAAALVLLAAGLGAGGYFALRYHHQSQVIARNDAAALKAAVDCVSATQAPDTNAMVQSEQKIIECGTDAYRSQALLYTNMIVQAYQAANVHVQVSDARAAVERNNDDGTVDVLVAMRVKVSSDQSQKETGYRLRVRMAFAEGQYRISKLDQVTK